MPDIIWPGSPSWPRFLKLLCGPSGLNITFSENDCFSFFCSGSFDDGVIQQILFSMGNVDVNATMNCFQNSSLHCPCEVMFLINSQEEVKRALKLFSCGSFTGGKFLNMLQNEMRHSAYRNIMIGFLNRQNHYNQK